MSSDSFPDETWAADTMSLTLPSHHIPNPTLSIPRRLAVDAAITRELLQMALRRLNRRRLRDLWAIWRGRLTPW